MSNCWCHEHAGLDHPADGPDKLCVSCRGRSPSACQTAHAAEKAKLASEPIQLEIPYA